MFGEQLVVPHVEGRTYYDLWNGTRLSPRIVDGQAHISLTLETRGYGAVLALESGATVEGLDALLAQMKKYNEVLAAIAVECLAGDSAEDGRDRADQAGRQPRPKAW